MDESSGNSADRTPYRFTGKEFDEETQLYYFGARYYDPRISLWTAPDPALGSYLPESRSVQKKRGEGDVGKVAWVEPSLLNNWQTRLSGAGLGGAFEPKNINLYAYAHQNPLKLTDPDGNENEEAIGAGLTLACLAAPDDCVVAGIWATVIVGAAAGIDYVMNQAAKPEPKAGDKHGGIELTDDDVADAVFDPDAMEDEKPRNQAEADAIRGAQNSSEGVIEIDAEDIKDPKHQGEHKIRVEKDGLRIHIYEDAKTGARNSGKIKQRFDPE